MSKHTEHPKRTRSSKTKPGRKGETLPGRACGCVAFPCVFTEDGGPVDATEAGNTLIKALNQLQEAAQSAEGRARWEAWQTLQSEVYGLRRGNVPAPLDLNAQPQLFIAAQAVSAWIDAFAPSYLPEGQRASRNGEAA